MITLALEGKGAGFVSGITRPAGPCGDWRPPAYARPMASPGALLHGRFELVAPLGAGGVGTVWRALDRAGGPPVALKVLHPHLRADAIVCERFRREAAIARELDHPAIVRALSLHEDAEALSIAFELLEGRTLKDAIRAGGPLAPAEAVRVARRCLEGLAVAHAAGVVHRDFKPHNVFLCSSGEVKLLDFGFARVASAAGLTTRSLVLCTPDYAAPEVAAGKTLDGRADLYAVGVTLYEALCGRLPFRAATPYELLRLHLEAPPPPLPEAIPPGLRAVVRRLLEKAPAARYATCAAALAAIEREDEAPLVAPRSVCPACSEPREAAWPLCPACGASERGQAAGEWMVVLMRGPKGSRQLVLEVISSVGARPFRRLERSSAALEDEVPRVILKGIGEPLARLVRERCQARELQVELRRYRENNSDLLHRSNTPGYLFALAVLLPWGLGTAALLYGHVVSPESWSLVWPILSFVLGPLFAAAAMTRAHRFLPALAELPLVGEATPLPGPLVVRYRNALASVRAPQLRGTLRMLLERTLVLHAAGAGESAQAQALLALPRATALRLAGEAIELAQDAQAAQDRLERCGETELWESLEALRAQAQSGAGADLAAAIAAKEAALAEVAALERAQIAATQRLLRVAGALELAAVQVLAAGAPDQRSLSLELEQLAAEAAASTARVGT